MREHLIGFIRAVQAVAGQTRQEVTVGRDTDGTLRFGYGYHQWDKVLYWAPANGANPPELVGELSVEAGVDRFLKDSGLE